MDSTYYDSELTLLSLDDMLGPKELKVIKKYGRLAAVTDLAVLTGCYIEDSCKWLAPDLDPLKARTGWFYTTTSDNSGDVTTIRYNGEKGSQFRYRRHGTVRPVLVSPLIYNRLLPTKKNGKTGAAEVVYGEYPQYAANGDEQKILDRELANGTLIPTGKTYTFDSCNFEDKESDFTPITCKEYSYRGKKYIRIKANSDYDGDKFKLSNSCLYQDGQFVWLEVSPVTWLVDEENKQLISKVGLVSGLRFESHKKVYDGEFAETEMKSYLNNYMINELVGDQTAVLTDDEVAEMTLIKDRQQRRLNPFTLNFKEVTEEDIIKGSIESGVAVFLHGASSEGKSARVMQIDPNCEIIYLRNATPESLNGKSVYNQKTGEMMDVPPTWLRKVEKKCAEEPDKLHIVFFDEITNALPSIQGIAFNIVLNREVNGMWKLPPNARIVAAGNDLKDSLAANKLAEPLFNRFAHVYIRTTTSAWLKWASEHNIHPAIYSYIAFKDGSTLRSKYDGEKPNADPRKWEMASKMLYKTGNPEMLRALIGEDITKEFVEFCSEPVITLERVLAGDYDEKEIQNLNVSSRYATTMGLTIVEEDNLEVARDFVKKIGAEFLAIFDSLWCHGDENRLERIAEARLTDYTDGGVSK